MANWTLYSSEVAAWNADQKDLGSTLFSDSFFFFISNLKGVGSNPKKRTVNLLNSVYTNKKITHPSSLSRVCAVAPLC